MNDFSFRWMVFAGVVQGWRVSASVALGVAIATAVIVGALLVGDSMRGSLRNLTLQRLGKIESAVVPGSFFDPRGLTPEDDAGVPLILFDRGVAEARDDAGNMQRAGAVQIIGIDYRFWSLDVTGLESTQPLDDQSIILNQRAADELNVAVGDLVTLRLPVEQAVPADSPLGRRDTETQGLPRMKVAQIIPDQGLGRFSLAASQASPINAYVNREVIAAALDRDGQANVMLFDRPLRSDELQLDLAAYGLSLRRVQQSFGAGEQQQKIFDYYSLTSDKLLLSDEVVTAIGAAFPADQISELNTYLANAIETLDDGGQVTASVPYSTITAIDSTVELPLDYRLPIAADPTATDPDAIPVAINRWTATQLDAEIGTPLRIAYYEPEVENGNEIERTFSAVVTDIVPLTAPIAPYRRDQPATFDRPPTVYNDPQLTPVVPGVTDQDSINDWDLPFQLERKISADDDQYWHDYRLTPKAFLPLAVGRQLFGSRFGSTTGVRFVADVEPDVAALETRLLEILAPIRNDIGWTVRPIRAAQLAASGGTTPFDGLFLSLSLFVILAAILLIAMLFRLGLIQRTKQFGTLLAIGWPTSRVAQLAFGEGLLIAAIGIVIGTGLGFAYASLVLWALRSWWVGAVTVPFLTFHWSWLSLLVGGAAGWLVAAVTLAIALRWLTRSSAQTLLAGQDPDATLQQRSGKGKPPLLAIVLSVAGLVIAGFGAGAGGQTAAGAFVGAGTMLLIAALLLVHWRLRRRRSRSDAAAASFSFTTLVSQTASRRPLRSTMTIGLMASAAFLIVAISAFRLHPSAAGTGGFTFIGQTAQPILRDLRQPLVQTELLGAEAKLLRDELLVPMRLRLGQDASCNNLYQATQPTVIGVPADFGRLFGPGKLPGFELIGHDATVWESLQVEATGSEDDPIPLLIDQNTAMWSLQMMGGVGEIRSFEYEPGKPVWFRVVGLLSNSVMQGKLLVGQSNFERLFPSINGYRFFLLAGDLEKSKQVATMLEDRLGDFGMDLTPAVEVLSGLMAVQNTYLRTFQSLGGLGLLLGTVGLAVAQLRSVLERRQELAVMRAIGFTRLRLATLVLSETAILLIIGVGCGVVCAALVVIPHALLSGLRPPLFEPLVLTVATIAIGLVAGLFVVQRVVRMPLLESLRSE
jgi:ABC-type antimicrobial peptide transport system permease subunit